MTNKEQLQANNTTLDAIILRVDSARDVAASIPSAGEGITLQEKTVMPSQTDINVKADSGYTALSSVTVKGDANLKAENIKKDVTLFGITGTCGGGIRAIVDETVTVTSNVQGGSAVIFSSTSLVGLSWYVAVLELLDSPTDNQVAKMGYISDLSATSVKLYRSGKFDIMSTSSYYVSVVTSTGNVTVTIADTYPLKAGKYRLLIIA